MKTNVVPRVTIILRDDNDANDDNNINDNDDNGCNNNHEDHRMNVQSTLHIYMKGFWIVFLILS